MLTWPLIAALLIRFFDFTKGKMSTAYSKILYSTFSREVLSRWLLSYILFKLVMVIFIAYCQPFDPSGHVLCALVTYSNWLALIIFISNYQTYFKTKVFGIYSFIAIVLFVYQIYGCFFTVLVYHDVYESIFGFGLGITISFIAFRVDAFSNALYYTILAISQAFSKNKF